MPADKRKLGDLPVPKTWEDLLNPIYRDKIVVFAFVDGINKDSVYDDASYYPHIYYYQRYGKEVVRQFGRNVVDGYHGVKMAKPAAAALRMREPSISYLVFLPIPASMKIQRWFGLKPGL